MADCVTISFHGRIRHFLQKEYEKMSDFQLEINPDFRHLNYNEHDTEAANLTFTTVTKEAAEKIKDKEAHQQSKYSKLTFDFMKKRNMEITR